MSTRSKKAAKQTSESFQEQNKQASVGGDKSIGAGGPASGSDGINHIEREHKQVHDLFQQYKTLQNSNMKSEIVEKIAHDLAVHSSIEERYLYPLCRDRLDNGKDVYVKLRFDHSHIKETLALLLTWNPDQQGSVYDEMVIYLEMLVTTHVRTEERYLETLRAKMSAKELAQLDSDLTAGEATAPTLPHPMGPDSELASKIMHPVAGMLDAAMQKIKDLTKDTTKDTSSSSHSESTMGSAKRKLEDMAGAAKDAMGMNENPSDSSKDMSL